MEVLSGSLQAASDKNLIAPINKCKALRLTHLAFADNLMIFSKTDGPSIDSIMLWLNLFASMSSLRINPRKSLIFLSGILDASKVYFLEKTGFDLGSLPVRYLGLPLIPTKLSAHHCSPILDLIRKRHQS
ncbi:uncharacterized protein LOC122064144 [Macadamia integrifolia]|uniref:uncharacterized protein LOC122064144 n=1 Tax=Macadamia integrifolia TaxID=60698 RepID=UPI001C4F242B|nr:uncharacterized protein LOC122064144 [Macadamia integrifolia]